MTNRVTKHDSVISSEQRQKISDRYKRITKAINKEFWNSESETRNSFYVGSYGRGTAINTSDIDILVSLPSHLFDSYNNLSGNVQSRLLQAVRSAIKQSYPTSDIRADGQIVKINFCDGILFEILPAFQNIDGTYIYPDSNLGGNWLSTNPKAEQDEMRKKNKSSNGLLVATCQHLRDIRDNNFKSYHLSGIVIDSFVYEAIGNWRFASTSKGSSNEGTYEKNLLEHFNKKALWWRLDFESLKAPGSGDDIDTKKSIECLEKVLKYIAE